MKWTPEENMYSAGIVVFGLSLAPAFIRALTARPSSTPMFDVSILIDLHILSFFLKEPVFPNQKLKKQPSFEKFVLAMLFCLACRGITRSAEFKCKLPK